MLQREVRNRPVRVLRWAHAIVTALVIVGTGNHWVLDAVGGWVVVAAGRGGRRGGQADAASRPSAFRTNAGSVVVHIGGRLALRKVP